MFFDICRTRVLVMGFTPGWSCKARCTVPVDMPSASARSNRVTRQLMGIVSEFGSAGSRAEVATSSPLFGLWGWARNRQVLRSSVNDCGGYFRSEREGEQGNCRELAAVHVGS